MLNSDASSSTTGDGEAGQLAVRVQAKIDVTFALIAGKGLLAPRKRMRVALDLQQPRL